jgi:hypothetical protein
VDSLSSCVLDQNTQQCVVTVASLSPEIERQLAIDSMLAATEVPLSPHLAAVEAGFMLAPAQCSVPGSTTYKAPDYKGASAALASAGMGGLCDPENVVVAKFNAGGSTAGASTGAYLIGGGDADSPVGIGIDASNNVYVAGQTASQDFPTGADSNVTYDNSGSIKANGSPDPSGTINAFVVKMALPAPTAPPGTRPQLGYSSTMGGSGTTTTSGIAVTPSGTVYLSGVTTSTDSAVVPPAPPGAAQAYVVQIPPPAPSELVPVVDPTKDYLLTQTTSSTVAVGSATIAADGISVTLSSATVVAAGNAFQITDVAFQCAAGAPFVNVAKVIDTTHFTLTSPYPCAPTGPLAYTIFVPTPTLQITSDADGNVVVAGAPSGNSLGLKLKTTINATIDIKPKAKKNNINLSTRYVQVAILSTQFFDAPGRIDQKTLTFGHTGGETTFVKCDKKGRKVNKDKILDLVCTFSVAGTHFVPTDTVGILNGKTKAGANIVGSDSITVVPPKKGDKAKDFDDDDAPWTDNDDK